VAIWERKDEIPLQKFKQVDGNYLEGYIQALVDMHYYEYRVIVKVNDNNDVTLYNLPRNELISNSITSFVKDLPGVNAVKTVNITRKYKDTHDTSVKISGIWFPQNTVLFAPILADPRQPNYYLGYRFGDRVMGNKAASIGIGDEFPVYRWRNVLTWQGDMQIGIEGAIWTVFKFVDSINSHKDFSEMRNIDFFLGLPITYAFDKFSFRLHFYHISGHLGDEYLVSHNNLTARKNPSYEAVDFFTSYQLSKNLRLYVGPGYIFKSDRGFYMKHLYLKYGAELRVLEQKMPRYGLHGSPFFAVHLENWQVRKWDIDMTFKAGYEISKFAGVGRKMRIYLSYHHGFSSEGQFFKERTRFGEVGFSWGF